MIEIYPRSLLKSTQLLTYILKIITTFIRFWLLQTNCDPQSNLFRKATINSLDCVIRCWIIQHTVSITNASLSTLSSVSVKTEISNHNNCDQILKINCKGKTIKKNYNVCNCKTLLFYSNGESEFFLHLLKIIILLMMLL